MINLEKTHKQKFLLQLQRTKKRKIIEEFGNGIRKGVGILIRVDKEILGKKSQLGVRSKVWSEKENLERSLISTSKSESL